MKQDFARASAAVGCVLVLACALALHGCGWQRDDTVLEPEVVPEPAKPLTANPDAPTNIRRGQRFLITLDTNPTTGYQWKFVAPWDEKVLTLLGETYVESPLERVGAGGTQAWWFKAVGQGETTVSFKYIRPWERDTPPAKTASFTIIVE